VSDGPVLQGSDLEAGNHYGATLPATYFTVDGVHHLYVVGFGDAPGDQRVFHASSADGISWDVDEADPFANLGIVASPPGPIPGSVVTVGDEFVMYLWAVPAPQVEGAQIYRAVAADPGGPWVADPEPVVPVGEPGDVDDLGIDFPAVVETEQGFLMLYGANGGDHPHTARILAATSPDGIEWDKHGRVIEPQDCGGEDTDFIAIPRLFEVDDGFLVVTVMGNDIYALRSQHGVTWECAVDGGPLFRATEVEGSDRVHTMAAAAAGSGINVMVEALFTPPEGEVYSNLWLAEVTGL
jgi:hypothetical protein